MEEVGTAARINLDDLKPLASGGQSKIYHYDDGNILRVPQREMDYERLRYEYLVYETIQDRVQVPRVRALLEVEGKPCIVMERIDGTDLLKLARGNPLRLLSLPRELAKLHCEVLGTKAGKPLVSHHEKAASCIDASHRLSEGQKRSLLAILRNLDGGTSLCHGDFHPGNIMCTARGYVIIDWSAASYGSPCFDIAHSFLLMLNTPRIPSQSRLEHAFQSAVAARLAHTYLKEICSLLSLSPRVLWKYFLIVCAERTYYGMESEQEALASFLSKWLDAEERDIGELRRLS